MDLMNTGIIMIIVGAVLAGSGVILGILEIALGPSRREKIRKRIADKY
jgi:hypothetical protein